MLTCSRMLRLVALSFFPILIFVSGAETRAGESATGGKDGHADSEAPVLVPSEHGGTIAVWRNVAGDGSELIAQKLDGRGHAIWRPSGVTICHEPVSSTHFSAVTDGSGGLIVVWEDSHKNVYDTDIYAQHLDRNGKPDWSQNGNAVCIAIHQQQLPKAVADRLGGAFAFWTDYRNGNADIYGCRLDKQGLVSDSFTICSQKDDQLDLSVAPAVGGGACIVWDDHRYDLPGIYAQLVDSKDSLRWTKDGLPICTGNYQQESPRVISTDDNRFVISWDDYRNRSANVFYRLLDSDGRTIMPSNGIGVSSGNGPQYDSDIGTVDSSAAIISWLQYDKGATIRQQRILLSRSSENRKSQEISIPSLAQFWPSSVPDGEGGSVTAWLQYCGGRIEVAAQRTGSDVAPKWPDGGIALGSAKEKCHPSVLFDSANRIFYVSFTTVTTGGSRILIVCLNEDGGIDWKREL